MVLKILQHDKIWGGDNPQLQILGDLSPLPPVIYPHAFSRETVSNLLQKFSFKGTVRIQNL